MVVVFLDGLGYNIVDLSITHTAYLNKHVTIDNRTMHHTAPPVYTVQRNITMNTDILVVVVCQLNQVTFLK